MIYQPLDVSRFEARLLRLLETPSELDRPLRFEVITYSLIRPPEYFALSYSWGDSKHQTAIEINGELVYVSKNLGAALRQLNFDSGAMIWADAICINQHDANEKAHQIRSMGLIYSKAQATVVWLGEEQQDTQHTCELLKKIYLEDQDQLNIISNDSFKSTLGNALDPVRSLRGLHELLTRPYWERVWIIQEIAKARTVWVRCGSLYFDLPTLIACSEHVDGLPQRSRFLISAIEEFRLQELEAQRGALRMTLLEALIRSRYFLATNPRDKVYALLNLARDGNDLVPTPTYTEPIEEVYRELTMTFLRSPHPIEAAILSSWAPLNVRPGTWPSWAVNWADLAFNVPPWLTSNLQARFSQPRKEKGFGIPTFSLGSVKLRGQGQLFGNIQHICDPSTQPTQINNIGTALKSSFPANLFRLLFPGSSKSQTIPERELILTLVHTIACTRKPYIQEILRHLGPLMDDPLYLRTWAEKHLGSERMIEKFKVLLENKTSSQVVLASEKSRGFVSGKKRHIEPLENVCSSKVPTDSTTPQERVDPFAADQLCLAAVQIWDDAFSNINLSPEYGLRFATSGNNIVLVPRATREGDQIYRLDSCYLPIILRKIPGKPQSTFKIVGEACVGISSDGNWIAARDCPWLGKARTESLDLVF
ncbi:HET-domain-containing protein [Hypoxylon sp. FL0890]|nr:HET-domain-containing protein [Hypoxylon sp. FL0890]